MAGQNFQVVETHRGANSNDRRSFVTVQINGRPVKALLDTGADATLLTRKAAERVGVDLSSPGVKNSYMAHGVGAKSYRTWTAPIETFSVGTETIQRSQMQIMDGDIFGEADLLLGADFFLSHHLFIANSQHKIYFTYNGGRVFTFARSSQAGDKPEAGPASDSDGPKTADEYARRGKAHLSRGEAAAALADLDYAIRLAPGVAANYAIRARVHLELDQSDAIGSDLDKAIELDPNEIEPLLMRATRRVDHEDRVGAKLDIERARQLATPGSGQARSVANLYVAIDQPDAALPLLDDWIRAHRDDAMLGAALNERCWARGLANQMLDDARDDCRRAIKRDGQKADYLDSLGLVELRLHHYADAIKAYQQAISEQPKVAWSHYGLGLAKIRSGRIDAGNADLAAAKTLNPKIEERFAWLNL